MNKWYDFMFAFNCGSYTVVIAIWVYMTLKFPMWEYVNGYLWGLVLGFSLLCIGCNAYWFFSEDKQTLAHKQELKGALE